MNMGNNNTRIASVDILRGIAIAGMILCANIGFNSGLPAWMFHAQTPPPTYAFNPDVAGLTWVDLVFPFFLFPMGAAFPLAMRKKLERGYGRWRMVGNLVKRWLILTVFALLLGNAYAIWGTARPAWSVYAFNIAVWAGMFLTFVRVNLPEAEGWKKHIGTGVNLCGVAMLALLGVVFVKWFGIPLDKGRSDIIIMILANVALWGGIVWMLTKDSLRLRWLAFMLIAAFKALDSYAPETLSWVQSCGCVSWFFTWDWLQYLLIALPGSIVGDMILSHARSGEKVQIGIRGCMAGFTALAAVFVQLWGLYTRHVYADLAISAALCIVFMSLTWKSKDIFTGTALTGFALMLAGIALDPADGGITKDYCNLSYLFTTGGMAALVTAFFLMLELRFGCRCRFVAGVGQNPMLAYTVTSFLIGPVLALTGLLPALNSLAEGSQFWGVAQGVIITALMMCVTYLFTRLKLFWRS